MTMREASTGTEGQGWLMRLARWWGERRGFDQLPEAEVARMAQDLGLSPHELETLAARGPGARLLLEDRLAALGLARSDVERLAPGLLRDVERCCRHCVDTASCARDLALRPDDPVWQSYCPNAATLTAALAKGRAAV